MQTFAKHRRSGLQSRGFGSEVLQHDVTQKRKLAVEEMPGAGHHRHGQVLRPRPIQDFVQRHNVIDLTLDHQGVGGHGRHVKARDSRADQHQARRRTHIGPICRAWVKLGSGLSGDVAPERKPRQREWLVSERGITQVMGHHGQQV